MCSALHLTQPFCQQTQITCISCISSDLNRSIVLLVIADAKGLHTDARGLNQLLALLCSPYSLTQALAA